MVSSVVRKEVLLVQNLKLLGFSTQQSAAELDANAFDRPNEKLLFRVLYFLLTMLSASIAQKFRSCWPAVTPQSKAKFKRVVHVMLSELERQQVLPVGSSQIFQSDTCYSSPVVDLLWRLSTYVMKTVITSNFPAYILRLPSSTDSEVVSTSKALAVMKAQIAVKTHQFKTKCATRSHVQQQWCGFATEISGHIKGVTALQSKVDEVQRHLKVEKNHDKPFCGREDVRATALADIDRALKIIQDQLGSAAHQKNQLALQTLQQQSENQPVLNAANLNPREASHGGAGDQVNLVEVVKNAETLIQCIRARIEKEDISQLAPTKDNSRLVPLVDELNCQSTVLDALVQQLQYCITQTEGIEGLGA